MSRENKLNNRTRVSIDNFEIIAEPDDASNDSDSSGGNFF
jgi:hypothetical protein